MKEREESTKFQKWTRPCVARGLCISRFEIGHVSFLASFAPLPCFFASLASFAHKVFFLSRYSLSPASVS